MKIGIKTKKENLFILIMRNVMENYKTLSTFLYYLFISAVIIQFSRNRILHLVLNSRMFACYAHLECGHERC